MPAEADSEANLSTPPKIEEVVQAVQAEVVSKQRESQRAAKTPHSPVVV